MQSVIMMKVSQLVPHSLSKSLKLCFCELSRIRALSTAVPKKKEKSQGAADAEQQLFIERQEDLEQKEHYIEMRRNKSRLYPQHRNVLRNKVPYTDDLSVPYDYVKSVRWNRRMYGRYGDVSNVDPRIAWPTAEDVMKANEYESLLCPKTIQQMVEEEKEKIVAKEKTELEQDAKIAANLAKMDAWKEEIKAKLTKKLLEASVAKNKREKLIEEVRRHVGYHVDPKDARFQEMLEAKEKEERKARKEEKKKREQEQMVQKMLKMAEDDKKERQEKKKAATDSETVKD